MRLILLWHWWPQSILATGGREETCPGAGGLVPPSCSPLWHPVSLQSRAPLASEMSQFQANKQALQSAKSSGRNHKEISVSCVSLGPPLGRSSNPFKAEAGLSSCLLPGDRLQCCDTFLPVALPTEPGESQGAGLPFIHCPFKLSGPWDLIHSLPGIFSRSQAPGGKPLSPLAVSWPAHGKNPSDFSRLRKVARDTISAQASKANY